LSLTTQNAALWPNILGLGVHGHYAEPTFTLYSSAYNPLWCYKVKALRRY
jgi:hypothetical protein